MYKPNRRHFCSNNNYCIINNNFKALSLNKKSFMVVRKYSALELINDLKAELQQFSVELALLFPNRVHKFGHKALSIFLEKNPYYISKIIWKINNNLEFNFLKDDDELKELESKMLTNFGLEGKNIILLINKFRDNKITILQFITLIEIELGRISGSIILTDYELGLILIGNEKYIERLKSRITNPNDSDYNPNYKFSIERLSEFKNTLWLLLREKSNKCIEFINKYKQFNPDLKEYSNQRYNLKFPHIFTNFDLLDTFYWLGYLYADGYINNQNYRVAFELSSRDCERVESFAKFIGLDSKYIHKRNRIFYLNEIPQFYNMTFVYPVCKPMVFDLYKLGHSGTKASRKELPKIISNLIDNAKKEDKKKWFFTSEGKKATTWLFGLFDGDGAYSGFHTARFGSASKYLLEQIKYYFDIQNKITIAQEPDTEVFIYEHKFLSSGYYRLNLGGNLFQIMLRNYKNTLKRKRPLGE